MTTQSHIDKVNLKPNMIPYPVHVGSPVIRPTDLTSFKKQGIDKVSKIFDNYFLSNNEYQQNKVLLVLIHLLYNTDYINFHILPKVYLI